MRDVFEHPCPACDGAGGVERRCGCAAWVGPWCPWCECWVRWVELCGVCGGSGVVVYAADAMGPELWREGENSHA